MIRKEKVKGFEEHKGGGGCNVRKWEEGEGYGEELGNEGNEKRRLWGGG